MKESFTPPESFAEYRLLRLLGQGTMGRVYLAEDTLLQRPVAIKFLAGLEPDEEARERFYVEARAIARLQHPHVVAIHRAGELDGQPYLVSEYVRGTSLDRLERPLPWQRVLEIGLGLSRGLAVAHRQGVLHRDIKPANAMVGEDGQVKLLDFGLAKLSPAGAGPGPEPDAGDAALLATTPSLGLGSPLRRTPADLSGPSTLPLTRAGDVLGTPLYMAPELWRNAPANRQTDIYALGVLLYELAAGHAPLHGLGLAELERRVQEEDPPPLRQAAPPADPRLCAIIDRCVARDPRDRYPSGDALCEALERLAAPPAAPAIPAGNPYRGLRSFDAEHRGLFFGRGAEVRALLDRLRTERFVLLTGDSGVGKSSLCRAGVLPAVAEGALGPALQVLTMVPGRHPLRALAAALAGDGSAGPAPDQLLFIDQIEEALTLADAAEAARFGAALAELLLDRRRVRVLAAVRSDYLTRLSGLPGLGPEVSRAIHLLGPLPVDGLREAIVEPARAQGFHFDPPALVDTLLASAGRAEGALPLLQFALAQLWEARDEARRSIPAAALAALGGVEGALARHADDVLRRLLPAQRGAARRLLGKLITVEGTRARRSAPELLGSRAGESSDARAALEALLAGRLLVARAAEDGGETSYELAHEALLSGWDTLRGWLARDTELRILQQRLERAAAEWERLQRAPEALWNELQLHEIAGADLDEDELGPREQRFLQASRRGQRRRRRLRAALFVGVPVLLMLAYGAVRLAERQRVNQRVAALLAEARAALEEAREEDRQVEELRRRALGHFDRRQQEQGELLWEQVVPRSRSVRQDYARASHAAEAAAVLSANRSDVQALLALVLYERILVAERDGVPLQREDLLQRLPLYDRGGTYRERLAAPAALELATDPSGAQAALERISEDERRGRHAVGLGPIGTTPLNLDHGALAPGAYTLVLSLRDRATVRYPLLLRRGERLALRVRLPERAEVPEGFVYVPAGRFLFGSGAEEGLRREFLYAAPLHEAHTGAYLVARQETTFAEWIEYLRALPAEERARRRPRAGAVGFYGSLDLRALPDGAYELLLQPATQAYRARAGDKLRYAARGVHAEQDWLRFPVAGISAEDAEAYVGWLRAGRRLPGARLCTETEWERAARGADDREYPHGDRLDADDADFDRTYGGEPAAFGPDEVGSHPLSRSPFGVDDMAGNVWEWVTNSLSRKPYAARGGAYYFGAKTARSTNRQEPEPSFRSPTVGLRVCADAR